MVVWQAPTTGMETISRAARRPGSSMQSMIAASTPSRSASTTLRITPGAANAASNSDSMEAGPRSICVSVISVPKPASDE